MLRGRRRIKCQSAGKPLERQIRLGLALRGFVDCEAFSIEAFAGTAGRTSRRALFGEIARRPEWRAAPPNVNAVLTRRELADAAGEAERNVCFAPPPGSARVLRAVPGFEDYDEPLYCLRCPVPGAGTEGALRAFCLRTREIVGRVGLSPSSRGEEFESSR